MKKIAITTGDPAGIGPEITAKALQFYELNPNYTYIIYGEASSIKNGNIPIKISNPDQADKSGTLYQIEITSSVEIGKASNQSGKTAIEILNRVSEDALQNKIDAIVTCPISKNAIHLSDPGFIGHTEYFAQKSKTENVAMSFWGPYFNLGLLTTHLPLKEVTSLLTHDYIKEKINLIVNEMLEVKQNASFAMIGINPHASENEAFGKEDNLVFEVLQEFREQGIVIDGPFPADTFFANKAQNYDMIISAYHDQGLIPFKMLSKDQGVNVTLGLPFVRTSVDHGTAFDIAGKGLASEKSLICAIELAEKLLYPNRKIEHIPYSGFAKHYDEYMSHVTYDTWVNFILKRFNRIFHRSPEKILEMACGTANVATRLVKRGLEVVASDLSPEMLQTAALKPFCPQLYQANMLKPFPKDEYDLVLLLFDSLNYLKNKKEIEYMLNNVYDNLKAPGLFIFDISTSSNCLLNFDGFVNLEDMEQGFVIQTSDFLPKQQVQKTNFTFFNKKGFLYERVNEVHYQNIHSAKTIIDIVKKTDFQLFGIYSMDTEKNLSNSHIDKLDEAFNRLFFVLKKN